MERFDLKTVIRNPKTGAIIKRQPYRLHVKGGSKYFERPVNSGNLWFEDGRPAGQMVNGEIVKGEEHKEYIAPLSKDEKVLEQINAKDNRIKELEKQMQELELKAINNEKEPVVAKESKAPKKQPQLPKLEDGKESK